MTPNPPATISVSTGAVTGGSGPAVKHSPAVAAISATAPTTRVTYGTGPCAAQRSLAELNTCNGPAMSSN